jgi:hypothetical protein
MPTALEATGLLWPVVPMQVLALVSMQALALVYAVAGTHVVAVVRPAHCQRSMSRVASDARAPQVAL